MSRDIAISILRKFSAWRSRSDVNSIFAILVRPSTRKATGSPNRRRSSSEVVSVSSIASCSRPGGDRDLVHAHVDQDAGHLERVDQVGLAGEALLTLVDLGGEDVGALQELQVAAGVVLEDAVGDVVEAKHRPADFPHVGRAFATTIPERARAASNALRSARCAAPPRPRPA